MFNEEDINDGESEEKLKSKTANLEGLLSKVNGNSIFKKNKKMFENTHDISKMKKASFFSHSKHSS